MNRLDQHKKTLLFLWAVLLGWPGLVWGEYVVPSLLPTEASVLPSSAVWRPKAVVGIHVSRSEQEQSSGVVDRNTEGTLLLAGPIVGSLKSEVFNAAAFQTRHYAGEADPRTVQTTLTKALLGLELGKAWAFGVSYYSSREKWSVNQQYETIGYLGNLSWAIGNRLYMGVGSGQERLDWIDGTTANRDKRIYSVALRDQLKEDSLYLLEHSVEVSVSEKLGQDNLTTDRVELFLPELKLFLLYQGESAKTADLEQSQKITQGLGLRSGGWIFALQQSEQTYPSVYPNRRVTLQVGYVY